MSVFAKKSIADIWPIRNKRFLVVIDPKTVFKTNNNELSQEFRSTASFTSLITIKSLLAKGAKIIVCTSVGEVQGIPLNLRPDAREFFINAFKEENGYGFTNFFFNLSPKDKLEMLSKSSAQIPSSCNLNRYTGKTTLFSKLTNEEKQTIIESYVHEHDLQINFFPTSNMRIFKILKSELPEVNITMCHDPISAYELIRTMKGGDIVVFENLRFYAAEASQRFDDRAEFAHVIASYCDVIINDAFNISSRQLASTCHIPRLKHHCAAGFLMEKEISCFRKLLTNPSRPLVIVLGGIRIDEKLVLLKSLLSKVDKVILGGPIGTCFLQATGVSVGKSFSSDAFVSEAANIMNYALQLKVPIILPVDIIVTTGGENNIVATNHVKVDHYIVDVGPQTMINYAKELRNSKSVFWTGPLGLEQNKKQSPKSLEFARMLGNSSYISVVAGRKTCAAVREANATADISHMCSGGITALGLLQGNILPGIDAISNAYTDLDSKLTTSVTSLLHNTPLFHNCSSHNLIIIARKAVRRNNYKGDVLIHDGDHYLSMWLVASGQITACSKKESATTVARRVITSPHTVGQYEFLTQAISKERVWVDEDDTVTYQISINALHEAFDECPDLSVQVAANLSEPLRILSQREHQRSSKELVVLSNDLMKMQNPFPNYIPNYNWVIDTFSNVVSRVFLYIFSVYFDSNPLHMKCVAALCAYETARTVMYHNFTRILPEELGHSAIAVISSMFSASMASPLMIHGTRSIGNVIDTGFAASALSLMPFLSHGMFLFSRSNIEKRVLGNSMVPCLCIILSALCRVVSGLLFFPIYTHHSHIKIGSTEYIRQLIIFLIKQVIGLFVQMVSAQKFSNSFEKVKHRLEFLL